MLLLMMMMILHFPPGRRVESVVPVPAGEKAITAGHVPSSTKFATLTLTFFYFCNTLDLSEEHTGQSLQCFDSTMVSHCGRTTAMQHCGIGMIHKPILMLTKSNAVFSISKTHSYSVIKIRPTAWIPEEEEACS